MEVEKNYHYVDIFMIGEVDLAYKEEPENLEPEKCEGIVLISKLLDYKTSLALFPTLKYLFKK